jgi:YVTN family beta-propeller protein
MRIHTAAAFAGLLVAALGATAADLSAIEPSQVISLDGVEGRIDHMTVDEKSGKLYIAALGNNTVEVIDVSTGKRIDSIKDLKEPQGIAIIPDTQRVAIASGRDSKCRIYNAELKLVAQIDNLDDADNVRYDAKAKQVIVGYGSGALAIIDPQAGKKVREIKLDAHPESFQLETKGNRIFVNVPGAEQVAVVDRDKGTVIGKWEIPDAKSNFPMALDEANHRLFIGCRSPAKLVVFDTETGKSVASINIVGDTDDVFYDAPNKQLYVSGGGGNISVIAQKDADTYTSIAEIKTVGGARTSFFLPSSGTLFVAVPHRGAQKAELRGFKIADPLKH